MFIFYLEIALVHSRKVSLLLLNVHERVRAPALVHSRGGTVLVVNARERDRERGGDIDIVHLSLLQIYK